MGLANKINNVLITDLEGKKRSLQLNYSKNNNDQEDYYDDTKREKFVEKLKSLLKNYSIPKEGLYLIITHDTFFSTPSVPHEKISLSTTAFGPFQTCTICTFNNARNINVDQINYVKEILNLSHDGFELLSQTKFYFSSIENDLSNTNWESNKLEEYLERRFQHYFDTGHFLIRNIENSILEYTSSSLKKFKNKYFTHGYSYS